MLYEDKTFGALVAGVKVETVELWTGRQAEAVRDAIRAHNQRHGTSLRLIVPGDSVTDHARDRDLALYTWGVMIGEAVSLMQPDDGPAEVDVDVARAALRRMRALPVRFWRELSRRHRLLSGLAPPTIDLFLTSFGPAPSVVLAVGAHRHGVDSDEAVYRFFPTSTRPPKPAKVDGVDGIDVASVDYSDFIDVDLRPATVDAWLDKVTKLDDAAFYLASPRYAQNLRAP